MHWTLRHDRMLPLDRPAVMGILNVTPDSFSDGGELPSTEDAVARARRMAAGGADLLDVGGESTRPGAEPVDPDREAARVVPVVRALKAALSLPVSVDTRRAAVAEAALQAGADVVNDVSGFGDPAMPSVVARYGAGAVLMHMRGTPATMQAHAVYGDLLAEVAEELGASLERARAGGVPEQSLVLDPGIGFAKTPAQNLELLGRLDELTGLGRPLLLGASRKSFIGSVLGGLAPAERDAGTAGACVVGLVRGARIFRVHDVRTARHALDVAWAALSAGKAA